MIKRIRVIGVGTGDPGHVTGEAARALASVDVFLVLGLAAEPGDAVAARRALCDALVPADRRYRFVEVTGPRRGPDEEPGETAYGEGEGAGAGAGEAGWVPAWVDACAQAVGGLADQESTVGFLVWGDAVLDDPTLRVVDGLAERFATQGTTVENDVVAGVSPASVLAARHRISLGRNGAPVHITTGRRLVDEFDVGLGEVLVLLDEHLACAALVDAFPDLELFWGAYLGSPDELLVRGRLADVIDEVQRVRAEARRRRGWIADTYLLRQPGDAPTPPHAGPAHLPFPDVATWEPLTDGVVTVRPLTAEDWPVLLAESNNEESLRWGFDGRPLTEAEARHKTAEAGREWRRGRVARFVIVDAASGAGAGVLMVARMGPPGIGVVGYGIVPDFRGRGFTSRALTLVCGWVFAHTDIQRLELGHKVGNVASGKAAERAGFTREGILVGRLPNPDGTRSDEVSYFLLRPQS
ncbi:precorrin-6A synthase (deacetylating) [Humibacillus xanthopallidus]|uniref:Precorrin-6A synthase (Deacetylating) n=1 Tax=Humibacillus xanthopallidus TaxID=412689 RepID=A0A543I2U5_9MICO|nr:precorrin-6A synthase (deacetylating) [Humibacillus xanthopallidus]TQM64916.1 precorrin-6A synthase (deacetylating) [Humibacillus xanthopallidus]